jgi:hypothetical protein
LYACCKLASSALSIGTLYIVTGKSDNLMSG